MSIKKILEAWEMIELLSGGDLDKDAKIIDLEEGLFPWEWEDALCNKTLRGNW